MSDDTPNPHPHLKAELLQSMLAEVYTDALGRQQARLDELILHNARMVGNGLPAISFKGRTWPHSNAIGVRLPLVIPRPAKALLPHMAVWLAKQEELEDEQRLTGGGLTAVLNAIKDPWDLLRIVPECLHNAVQASLAGKENLPTGKPLTQSEIDALLEKQHQYLHLLKQRMVRNLIAQ